MAQTKAIVDKLLTQASNILIPQGFICEQILPPIYVQQKTGKLAKYGNNHLRLEATLGGGRGAFKRVEAITRSTDSYDIETHGLEGMVSADDYANVEAPYNAEEDETLGLTTLLYIKKEYSVASALTNASIMTQGITLSGEDQLSDYLHSDPLAVIRTAKFTIKDAIGMPPNVAAMDWKVYETLRFHPQLMTQLGYTDARPGGLDANELARALDLEKILIANGVYNSAKEGAADSLTSIWGKHLVLYYAPTVAAKYQKTLGYRMQLNDQRRSQRSVYKYSINNPPNSMGIIVQDNWDYFLTDTSAGYLITNAIA